MKVIAYSRPNGRMEVYAPAAKTLAAMMGGGGLVSEDQVDYEIEKFVHPKDREGNILSGLPEPVARAFIEGIAFGGMTEDQAIAALQAKDVPPDAVDVQVIPRVSLLASREFRKAWRWSPNSGVIIDMVEAREIHAGRIVVARMTALTILEKRKTHERLKGNTTAADKATADYITVVDLDLTALAAQISGAANTTTLSTIWPAELQEFKS